MNNNEENICCPPFNPEPWEEKTNRWENKLFIKNSIPQIFHMPFPSAVEKMIQKLWEKAEEANAAPDMKDFLLLTYDLSPWRSEFYMAVTKPVTDAETVTLSGTFVTKVFDGPYNHVPKWIKEMDTFLAQKNLSSEKYYFYFTTCPKCAKKYGHNYAVVFAQTE